MTTDHFTPIAPSDRVESIDVLRGVVVLGILLINITLFAFPYFIASNPTLWGTFEGMDIVAYITAQVGFEGAQRTIFSMLFGAGVLLFIDRVSSDERSGRLTSLYYRRMIGLMLFGLIDMYILLWFGDIIFLYGFVGLFLYFFRNASVQTLLVWSGVLLLILTLLFGGLQAGKTYFVQPGIETALEKIENGETLNLVERELLEVHETFFASDEQINAEIDAKRQGYFSAYPYIVSSVNKFQWFNIPFTFCDVLLMMLLGMSLYRLQVFDASRSVRSYALMVVLGFGVGVGINVYEIHGVLSTNFSLASQVPWTYHLGRLAMACGYIGTIMLVCKFGVIPRVRHCLAAVGRMALTNYLVQSTLCLFFFVVLGNFGSLRLHELYYVVFVIWFMQLIYSPVWLRRFRYGPAEYLWRRMTYGAPIANLRSTRGQD